VVLIFDGDAAGQNAADRALEIFLGHEVDVRVLTLPENLDPCDFLLRDGAEAFRALVARAVDPLAFALGRAGSRFDLTAIEGSRQAAEWLLGIFASVPAAAGGAVSVKVDKAVDALAHSLRLSRNELNRRLKQIRQGHASRATRRSAPVIESPAPDAPGPDAPDACPAARPVSFALRTNDLDPIERELVQIILNEPKLVEELVKRVAIGSIRDAALRTILQACYDLHAEGIPPTFDRVALRLDDPQARALAAGLLLPIEPAPLPDYMDRPPLEIRLLGALALLARREHDERMRDIQLARQEALEAQDHAAYQALNAEYLRVMNQRPDTKTKNAS
jgi:DNA primase